MASVIMPHVQAAPRRESWPRLWIVYACGTALGAAVTGTGLGLLGVVAQRVGTQADRATLVASLSALMLLVDLQLMPVSRLSPARQTGSTWYAALGPRLAFFYWGIDLGLGFTTIRLTSLYWALALGVIALLPPDLAPIVTLGYAAGLSAALARVSIDGRRACDATSVPLQTLRAAPHVKAVSAAMLTLFILIVSIQGGA